jgi:hypothetical protein
MTSEFKKILERIENQETSIPKDLVNNIIFSVDQKNHQRSKIKTLSLSFVSIASLALSIPIISELITSFTQSGIYNYFSLIFSDSDIAVMYWKEIIVTLAESIPIISVISLLAILAIFTWSTLKAMSEARKVLITI